jgi:hypothetical protein
MATADASTGIAADSAAARPSKVGFQGLEANRWPPASRSRSAELGGPGRRSPGHYRLKRNLDRLNGGTRLRRSPDSILQIALSNFCSLAPLPGGAMVSELDRQAAASRRGAPL